VPAGTGPGHHASVIRDVVLHMNNEQPLMADLFEFPEGNTALLRCTNLRMMNGRRPVFADDSSSTFFFPMVHLRFIEVSPRSQGDGRPTDGHLALEAGDGHDPRGAAAGAPEAPDEDLEIDEDFLRRIREA